MTGAFHPSVFSSKQLHTVNFACFHKTSIKLHFLVQRHCVQHIVATVVNIAVHSWNHVMSWIRYSFLRDGHYGESIHTKLVNFHNVIFMWKEPAARLAFQQPISLNLHHTMMHIIICVFFFDALTCLTNQNCREKAVFSNLAEFSCHQAVLKLNSN